MDKNLYIIAGCNGAGKTTASFTILSEILNCKEFVNADEIARGLSPFQPEKVSIEAGKIMNKRVLSGGHNVEDNIIERRYVNGIKNLFNIYISLADNVLIIDNSETIHQIIAKKTKKTDMQIIDNLKFNIIRQCYENKRI